MKTLNIFRKVFFVVGAVLMVAGVVGCAVLATNAIEGAAAIASGVSVVFLGTILLVLGLLLDSSKSEVAHKVGIGLHVAAVVMFATYALFLFIGPAVEGYEVIGDIECILLIAGGAVYGLGWFMTLLMHASRRYECGACGASKAIQPEEDAHIAAIMKWKKLYNEGIITEREFIDKRNEILGLRK